jgi:Asp-tRNA(Asn)/Glu-tRNA(Gln) amidotransferase B subunit
MDSTSLNNQTTSSPRPINGITMAAAKFVYNKIKGTDKDPLDVVNEFDLWMVDEWTHVGICCLVCIDNQKLVDTYKKGNVKVFDSLVGKSIKMANMTVDPELIRELLPLIIQVHF